MHVENLRAQGDRELFDKLSQQRDIKKAMEQYAEKADELGTRRHLLANERSRCNAGDGGTTCCPGL